MTQPGTSFNKYGRAVGLLRLYFIMSRFPDYYKLLNVTKSATQDEIRTAYKKESLKYIARVVSLIALLIRVAL